MRYTLTTAPTTTPITLAEAREWLAVQSGVTSDDSAITQIINEVTAYAESRFNGRKLINQTWEITLDEDEIEDVIDLRLVPLVSISSIKTYNDAGTESTVDSTNYLVTTGERPRVSLTSSGSWPTDLRDYDCMKITAVVGYGSSNTSIPEDIVMLLRGLVLHFYHSKGTGIMETVSGQVMSIPYVYTTLLKKYRVHPWK
jgi:uncharacterized phiE125 gp8 family phage protein